MDGKFIVYQEESAEAIRPWGWVFRWDRAALGEATVLAQGVTGFGSPAETEAGVLLFWRSLGLEGMPVIERRDCDSAGETLHMGAHFRAAEKSSLLDAARHSLATAEECEDKDDLVSMRDELLLGILQSNIAIAEALGQRRLGGWAVASQRIASFGAAAAFR